MVSSAANSENRVAKAPGRTRQASVTATGSKSSEPSPAVFDVPDGSVPLTIEDTDDPQELVDGIEQLGDFVGDEEESEASSQRR
jgi:hypothetical protein